LLPRPNGTRLVGGVGGRERKQARALEPGEVYLLGVVTTIPADSGGLRYLHMSTIVNVKLERYLLAEMGSKVGH
jgi:hypothetical protein